MCDILKLCTRCYALYKCNPSKPSAHKCPSLYCKKCKAVLLPHTGHKCFIQVPKPYEPTDKYDFECRQDDGLHMPNYLYCLHMDGESWFWEGEECVKFFERYRRPSYTGYTFLVHNTKGYDSYLLMNYLVTNGINLHIIAQGSKLMCITDESFKMHYIDSLNVMPMKLSAMPSALGFEARKGYFPHFFNTVENQNYVSPYPETRYYGVQQMKSEERDKSIKKGIFNFREEMTFYCKNDVDILKEACIRYCTEVYAIGQIDPFQCTTIASLCMAMYRSKFMPKDTIAKIPPDNYADQQKSFSNASIQWLMYVSETENVFIQHALNYGELNPLRSIVGLGPTLQLFLTGPLSDWVRHHYSNAINGCLVVFSPEKAEKTIQLPSGSDRSRNKSKKKKKKKAYLMNSHTWYQVSDNGAVIVNKLAECVSAQRLSWTFAELFSDVIVIK
ncbi:uncharacterized protein LOC131739443 [Acipenser ruthenus]|uniref:uncharacterized protein LOC131739443 n=1 Tax=Acipenser ruthenus TaxID=7906 RepID=UPI0027407BAD|nr:uncharacterized protein LOC131739443 [Acipenser ruthenus]